MSSVLQLDDFASPARPTARRYSAEQLAAEYQRGLAEGAAQAEDAARDTLIAALQAAIEAAQEQAALRRDATQQALQAVAPVMQAITDRLAARRDGMLADTLLAELELLCRADIPATCRIAGPVELIEQVGAEIEARGLSGITLLPGTTTEISFDGGRIALDPQEMIERIGEMLTRLNLDEDD